MLSRQREEVRQTGERLPQEHAAALEVGLQRQDLRGLARVLVQRGLVHGGREEVQGLGAPLAVGVVEAQRHHTLGHVGEGRHVDGAEDHALVRGLALVVQQRELARRGRGLGQLGGGGVGDDGREQLAVVVGGPRRHVGRVGEEVGGREHHPPEILVVAGRRGRLLLPAVYGLARRGLLRLGGGGGGAEGDGQRHVVEVGEEEVEHALAATHDHRVGELLLLQRAALQADGLGRGRSRGGGSSAESGRDAVDEEEVVLEVVLDVLGQREVRGDGHELAPALLPCPARPGRGEEESLGLEEERGGRGVGGRGGGGDQEGVGDLLVEEVQQQLAQQQLLAGHQLLQVHGQRQLLLQQVLLQRALRSSGVVEGHGLVVAGGGGWAVGVGAAAESAGQRGLAVVGALGLVPLFFRLLFAVQVFFVVIISIHGLMQRLHLPIDHGRAVAVGGLGDDRHDLVLRHAAVLHLLLGFRFPQRS